jgi:hypothetical protein
MRHIKTIKTTADDVAVVREIMNAAHDYAFRILGERPELIEEPLPNGGMRFVSKWADGEETNECVVNPIENLN